MKLTGVRREIAKARTYQVIARHGMTTSAPSAQGVRPEENHMAAGVAPDDQANEPNSATIKAARTPKPRLPTPK